MSTIVLTTDPRVAGLLALAPAPVAAVVVGDRAAADAVAAAPGVAAVTWVPLADGLPAEAAAGAVADLVAAAPPAVVLAAARPAERVLAGAVAARLGAPALSGVTAVTADDAAGTVDVTRPVAGGVAVRTERVTGTAVLVAEGGTAPTGDGAGAPVSEAATVAVAGLAVTEQRTADRAAADLGRANRIVAVGRGLRAREDLGLLEELAERLGAELACSRPLAEGVGWFPHDRYVGVTGQQVAPDLYLAVGVSGQLQHAVGARGAGTVVVVNSDPGCPYAAEADFCLVGDLYAVVPALTEALA